MNFRYIFLFLSLLIFSSCGISHYNSQPGNTKEPSNINTLDNAKRNGYRGIWFELNQKFAYGDKYSGGLGTYTAKHVPLAAYAPEVDKTFFVYGGTTHDTARYLICMIGVYDHKNGKVSKPTVVYDKKGVDDPHDNPSIMIGKDGYIWVFVSGRGRSRPGFKYRSRNPYSIDHFDRITEEEMTYPQPWNTTKGYLHLFTKYTGVRQLYFEHSQDGIEWSDDQMLAAIPQNAGERSGHYQTSATDGNGTVGTFFNRHPQGNVDRRTDVFYVQTDNLGRTWTDVKGNTLAIPLTDRNSTARVLDFYKREKNIYLKDMGFTGDGHPIGLFIRSDGHEPGPENAPYIWFVVYWDGAEWQFSDVTASDHNYDMGSLFIDSDLWRVVGPTSSAEESPQKWGVGGEIEVWQSANKGMTWMKSESITQNSQFNHSYVRQPLQYKSPFCFFWADGHAHNFSRSRLYFGDFDGNVWKLPESMDKSWERPEKVY